MNCASGRGTMNRGCSLKTRGDVAGYGGGQRAAPSSQTYPRQDRISKTKRKPPSFRTARAFCFRFPLSTMVRSMPSASRSPAAASLQRGEQRHSPTQQHRCPDLSALRPAGSRRALLVGQLLLLVRTHPAMSSARWKLSD